MCRLTRMMLQCELCEKSCICELKTDIPDICFLLRLCFCQYFFCCALDLSCFCLSVFGSRCNIIVGVTVVVDEKIVLVLCFSVVSKSTVGIDWQEWCYCVSCMNTKLYLWTEDTRTWYLFFIAFVLLWIFLLLCTGFVLFLYWFFVVVAMLLLVLLSL